MIVRPSLATHEIGVGRAQARFRKRGAPRVLHLLPLPRKIGRGGFQVELVGGENQHGGTDREVELIDAGRGQVLRTGKAARLLLVVEKIEVPEWIVPVGAVAPREDRRHAVVNIPALPVEHRLRQETKTRVAMMQRMKVAPGEEGTHPQCQRREARSLPIPPQHDGGMAARDKNILGELSLRQREGPARPRLGRKIGGRRRLGRDVDAGQVALPGNDRRFRVALQFHVAAIDQHHAAARRRGGGKQQGVVTARADAAHGATGETAQPVRLQPFRIRTRHYVPR